MNTKYLLDTNICVCMIRRKFNISERIASIGIENCYISDITLGELYYGAFNSDAPLLAMRGVDIIEKTFRHIPIDKEILLQFGCEKTKLRKKGQLIDDFDLLIGTTAIVHNLVMVTENKKHLERLPIDIENWVDRT